MARSGLFRQRLHHQHVARPGFTRPEDVIRHLGAVQSQDYHGAKWSVGMRLTKATDASLDEAFNAGRFLRTHVLRPTWFFVVPEDIRWMLELTSPHVRRMNGYVSRRFGVDAATTKRGLRIITRALEDGQHRTRAELAALLDRSGIHATGTALAYIVMEAELLGLVCSGAMKGKQHSYALLAERAPKARTLPRDEALGQLALRFVQGHSPATLRHFMWWSMLKLADAQRGLADVESQLDKTMIDGTAWYSVAPRAALRRTDTAHFIPEFDEALVGTKEMGLWDDPPTARTARGDSYPRPIIYQDRNAGTWRRVMGPRGVVMEVKLHAAAPPGAAAVIRRAAERYGAFLGRPVTLRLRKR